MQIDAFQNKAQFFLRVLQLWTLSVGTIISKNTVVIEGYWEKAYIFNVSIVNIGLHFSLTFWILLKLKKNKSCTTYTMYMQDIYFY